jgi:pyrimidine-nucleoside phosphorylase
MDAPLGSAVGNALEIRECVDLVNGRGSRELLSLVERLACRMLRLSGTAADDDAAAVRVRQALASGAAAEKLRLMIARQGGDAGVVDAPGRLPAAGDRRRIAAARSGFVTALDAEQIGRAAVLLGAGRERKDDPIDPAAGVLVLKHLGDEVAAGDTVLELHCNTVPTADDAEQLARGAVTIGDAPPPAAPLALAWVHASGEARLS